MWINSIVGMKLIQTHCAFLGGKQHSAPQVHMCHEGTHTPLLEGTQDHKDISRKSLMHGSGPPYKYIRLDLIGRSYRWGIFDMYHGHRSPLLC
jgi:hypothetical protein